MREALAATLLHREGQRTLFDQVFDLYFPASTGGPAAGILAEAGLTGWHGQSHYGTALAGFADRYPDAVGPRTAVFILGDARTNSTDPRPAALRQIADRARMVCWLNPEPRSPWSTGDSVALLYAEPVEMHPCRNARELGDLVGRVMPL